MNSDLIGRAMGMITDAKLRYGRDAELCFAVESDEFLHVLTTKYRISEPTKVSLSGVPIVIDANMAFGTLELRVNGEPINSIDCIPYVEEGYRLKIFPFLQRRQRDWEMAMRGDFATARENPSLISKIQSLSTWGDDESYNAQADMRSRAIRAAADWQQSMVNALSKIDDTTVNTYIKMFLVGNQSFDSALLQLITQLAQEKATLQSNLSLVIRAITSAGGNKSNE